MNCADYLRALSLHLHDPAGGPEPGEAVAHREHCPACTALFRAARETTCKELVSFLLDYVENTLDPKVHTAFDRHLEMCGACRSYLDSYRATLHGLQEQREPASPSLPDELVRAILQSLPSV